MESSTLYTIGTALDRAKDNGLWVAILVEGQWLTGRVAAADGHGVVLVSDEEEHSVIRINSVAAVRVFNVAPRSQATAEPHAVSPPAYAS